MTTVYQTKLCCANRSVFCPFQLLWSYLLLWVLCLLYTALWVWVVPGYVTPSERTKELCTLLNSDIWHLPFLLLFLYTIYTCLADECTAFANPFVSLWIWIHFLVDKMCICKTLMLAAGVVQDQLLTLSFFTVACTWQITLKSCFHNLLCLVVLPTAAIFMAALERKDLYSPEWLINSCFINAYSKWTIF